MELMGIALGATRVEALSRRRRPALFRWLHREVVRRRFRTVWCRVEAEVVPELRVQHHDFVLQPRRQRLVASPEKLHVP